KQVVASLMTEPIVDGLEAVKIHHCHGEAIPMPASVIGLFVEAMAQGPGVWKAGYWISESACFRQLMSYGVTDRIRGQLGDRLYEPEMVRFVGIELRGIQGHGSKHVAIPEQRHHSSGAVRFIDFSFQRVKIEPGIAVVHRMTICHHPTGYAGAKRNPAPLELF